MSCVCGFTLPVGLAPAFTYGRAAGSRTRSPYLSEGRGFDCPSRAEELRPPLVSSSGLTTTNRTNLATGASHTRRTFGRHAVSGPFVSLPLPPFLGYLGCSCFALCFFVIFSFSVSCMHGHLGSGEADEGALAALCVCLSFSHVSVSLSLSRSLSLSLSLPGSAPLSPPLPFFSSPPSSSCHSPCLRGTAARENLDKIRALTVARS